MKFRLIAASFALISALLLFPLVTNAKRAAPEDVPPVIYQGTKYVVVHWGHLNESGQNGGYVEARDAKTNEKIRGFIIYKTDYDQTVEADVQDVFITSLSIDEVHHCLIVKNELGESYELNLATGEVIRNEKR